MKCVQGEEWAETLSFDAEKNSIAASLWPGLSCLRGTD